MLKFKFILIFCAGLVLPGFCWALDMESLKTDFLQGNYRRVIFEGAPEAEGLHLGNLDELNYILGVSYLKESKLDLAQNSFRRVLNNPNSKFKDAASLGLADTYLVSGRFQEAEEIYNKLLAETASSRHKPAVLYRLSQIESKKGNHQKANDYLFKLKKDFPLSVELRAAKGINLVNTSVEICELPDAQNASGEYSVQVGFFTNSSNANNFKDTLLSKNYPAYIENSGTGYRVKVGKFKSQKEALDLESKLSRDGFPTKVCPL